MLGKRGQTSTELIVIAAVILVLFLVVMAIVVQRNFFTSLTADINDNILQCNQIAAVIANFQANQGYSQTMLTMQKDVLVSDNDIKVNSSGCPNCHYCYHNGTVADAPVELHKGTTYLVKTTDSGVDFIEQ